LPSPKLKTLKNSHEIIALLDARGCSDPEISDATGYAVNHIWRIRNELPEYKVLLSEIKRQIQEQVIDNTADSINAWNARVPVMRDNLEDLALRANKEGVRLSATRDWLDRAPDAPKRVIKEESTQERKIIFSVQQVDNMKAGLIDVGKAEIVDLLEGEDYTVEQDQAVVNVDND
jgi:hypothetical protein